LREALGRAPIEDDTLMALLILAFAGQNVTVATGTFYGRNRLAQHAATLFNAEGGLHFDIETLRVAARLTLMDVFSCRENATNSGIVARVAGQTIGADGFLCNMGTEEFLSCLSRPALEAACSDTSVLSRQRVKDTRAALVEHFKEERFVHPSALFAPSEAKLTYWLASNAATDDEDREDLPDEADATSEETTGAPDESPDDSTDELREAA
ncbi:MAG: plasmid partitioning protein, partial [Shinella sp.]